MTQSKSKKATGAGRLSLARSRPPERLIGLHRDIDAGQADIAKHKIRELHQRDSLTPAFDAPHQPIELVA
jgi:hypothetical protein